jgi:hypothetical protein
MECDGRWLGLCTTVFQSVFHQWLEQHFWQQACFCVALQGLLKSHGVTGPQILKFDQSTPPAAALRRVSRGVAERASVGFEESSQDYQSVLEFVPGL